MPDPSLGVFETLLVLDGHPVEWDAHRTRLQTSLTTLYPNLDVPVVNPPQGWLTTGTSGRGAVRIAVAPRGGAGFEVEVESREAPRAGVVSLHTLRVIGGLGAHKWVDRSLLDHAQARLPDGGLPLIADGDDALEASRANLFAVRDEALFTPPLDGRILPGVTRARVLAIAGSAGIEAREAPLSHDDLHGADEVFLSGSVRGIDPVVALDGTPLRRDGGVAERIAAELWRAWADAGAPALFG